MRALGSLNTQRRERTDSRTVLGHLHPVVTPTRRPPEIFSLSPAPSPPLSSLPHTHMHTLSSSSTQPVAVLVFTEFGEFEIHPGLCDPRIIYSRARAQISRKIGAGTSLIPSPRGDATKFRIPRSIDFLTSRTPTLAGISRTSSFFSILFTPLALSKRERERAPFRSARPATSTCTRRHRAAAFTGAWGAPPRVNRWIYFCIKA